MAQGKDGWMRLNEWLTIRTRSWTWFILFRTLLCYCFSSCSCDRIWRCVMCPSIGNSTHSFPGPRFHMFFWNPNLKCKYLWKDKMLAKPPKLLRLLNVFLPQKHGPCTTWGYTDLWILLGVGVWETNSRAKNSMIRQEEGPKDLTWLCARADCGSLKLSPLSVHCNI